jgi:hypothetical protein
MKQCYTRDKTSLEECQAVFAGACPYYQGHKTPALIAAPPAGNPINSQDSITAQRMAFYEIGRGKADA